MLGLAVSPEILRIWCHLLQALVSPILGHWLTSVTLFQRRGPWNFCDSSCLSIRSKPSPLPRAFNSCCPNMRFEPRSGGFTEVHWPLEGVEEDWGRLTHLQKSAKKRSQLVEPIY